MVRSPGSGLEKSLEEIRSKTHARPKMALILGSGLGDLVDSFSTPTILDTRDIPGYPVATVEGHKGQLAFTTHSSVPLVAFQGRLHFYECGDLETVLFPVRIAIGLGAEILLVTNAAGGINPGFEPGDLMLIVDQLNLTGEESFQKMVDNSRNNFVYDKELIELIKSVSSARSIHLWTGVYGGVKGPSYETAAEVQMVRTLGGDAVGMSTVLEASFAASLGMRVAGMSCITNKATGIASHRLSHDEVTVAANRAKRDFSRLVLGVVEEIGRRGV
jgi:purine-nucleoside phosphorylase